MELGEAGLGLAADPEYAVDVVHELAAAILMASRKADDQLGYLVAGTASGAISRCRTRGRIFGGGQHVPKPRSLLERASGILVST